MDNERWEDAPAWQAAKAFRGGRLITNVTDHLPAAHPGPTGHGNDGGPAFDE